MMKQDGKRTDPSGAPDAKERMRQRRGTVLLAAALILALFAAFLIRQLFFSGSSKDASSLRAVIQIDGETVHTMDLDTDAEYRAGTSDGPYNLVVVKDQSVMVKEADCKNQVCVKTGRIRNPGEVIACLPHRMIIYIE